MLFIRLSGNCLSVYLSIILESGSMLKQLDVALQQYATQQQKQQADQVHYVAKVQSKTTSRRYL